jgi:hypothetical protein
MGLGQHVIWADVHLEEGELAQFAAHASLVQVGDSRSALVLDALDARIAKLLGAGELGWIRYDDADWSLLICMHPEQYADAERSGREREDVRERAMRSGEIPLPLDIADVRRALAAGGQTLYVTLSRIEIRVRVEDEMARQLLTGKQCPVLESDLLPEGNARAVLWCPRALGAGQVPYRRLH